MTEGDIIELLRLFADDNRGELWWVETHDGGLEFLVDCSDSFHCATADAEPVELPDDFAGLRQAKADLPDDFPLLWVARKRGMRLSHQPKNPRWRELFEAAGPPRGQEQA